MRKKTGSFLKRIATGGVLAAGVALLFATGCVALDEEIDEDEEGLVDYAEGEEDMHDVEFDPMPTHAEGDGDLTAMCHFGPTMMQADSVDILVTESEVGLHLSHGDSFGTCADFFCGAS